MGRSENVAIFEDTRKPYQTYPELAAAIRNPPSVVASAMKQVVEEFRYHFRVIEFAVYCSPRDERNYQVFQQILGGL